MKMLVIADDFTGANDTGVQLAKKGARTEVQLQSGAAVNSRADVLVINTESRAVNPQTAAQRVTKAVLQYASQHPIIYKKIDSTFRGNPGAEIAAALEATGARLAIVAAAIPAAGRTTQDGYCLVNQQPLHTTEFASDPKTPIRSSRIATILASQTALPVQELSLTAIRSASLNEQLTALAEQRQTLVVMDAETEEDLNAIAHASARLACPVVYAGAAGLANALPTALYLQPRSRLPLLIVAGSMSEATRTQIRYASERNQTGIVDIFPEALLDDEAVFCINRLADEAAAILLRQQHCILRTSRSEQERALIDSLCEQWKLTRQQLGETLSQRLAELTLAILRRAQIGALFLTGGDIATAVAAGVHAQGYRIAGELAPCIPWGYFTHSDIDDLPVVTKAGGFGGEKALSEVIEFLEQLVDAGK
ncbi:four-carbon acid sugar kinase family protein [Kalamiella sp. sgz302252]|uniref:D-threonate kinase n=1 Tax=Pantoea sp. sgz302252 TaxID=3341827 RepID=UPI0036D3C4C9